MNPSKGTKVYAENPLLLSNNNIVIEIIGPIEAIPTKPKASLVALRPPLTVAIPAPKAKIKGTVADPVVIPPESKMNGKNFLISSSIAIKHINKKTMK